MAQFLNWAGRKGCLPWGAGLPFSWPHPPPQWPSGRFTLSLTAPACCSLRCPGDSGLSPWRQVEGGPGRQAESWRSRTGCVRSWLNRYWGTGERKQGSLISGHSAADVEVGRGFHTRRDQSRSDGVTRDCPGSLAARCQSRPPLLQKSCPLGGFCQPRQPQVL